MTVLPLTYAPPTPRLHPSGEVVAFEALCALAGIRCTVTGRMPEVRLHGQAEDFRAVAPGRNIACLGRPLLAGDPRLAARQVLDKLAYQFHDWAAREVLAADRRRPRSGEPAIATFITPTAWRVLGQVVARPSLRVGELAAVLALAQPHVSRALAALLLAGWVQVRPVGRTREVRASTAGWRAWRALLAQ